MKRMFNLFLAAVLILLSAEVSAGIVIQSPPEVPANIDARDFRELSARRNSLLDQYGAVQTKIDRQGANCHSVEEGSPKVNECLAEAQEVKSAVRQYREALKTFSTRIAAAVDWTRITAELADATRRHESSPPNVSTPDPGSNTRKTIRTANGWTIESHGEFHILGEDGKPLPDQDLRHITIRHGMKFVTGSDGYAMLALADNTHIQIKADTVFVPVIKGPKPAPGGSPAMELVKGTFRWLHQNSSETMKELKEAPGETRSRLIREGRIKVSTFALSVQGTEFDCTVLSDGSGNIRLYSGKLSVAAKTGAMATLKPGQMITFTRDKLDPVTPIPDGAAKSAGLPATR